MTMICRSSMIAAVMLLLLGFAGSVEMKLKKAFENADWIEFKEE